MLLVSIKASEHYLQISQCLFSVPCCSLWLVHYYRIKRELMRPVNSVECCSRLEMVSWFDCQWWLWLYDLLKSSELTSHILLRYLCFVECGVTEGVMCCQRPLPYSGLEDLSHYFCLSFKSYKPVLSATLRLWVYSVLFSLLSAH